MRKEATGSVVCGRCYDGRFDLKRHPQNRPARPRAEPSIVPDGRPDQTPAPLLAPGQLLNVNFTLNISRMQ